MQRVLFLSVALGMGMATSPVLAQVSFEAQQDEVNQRLVKIFGSGGFRGLTSYGTGILISKDGYILTAASQMLDTTELRIHLSDGRKLKAALVVVEPELDAALVKIKFDEGSALELPFYDIPALAKRPHTEPGAWVLAFSNQFKIADRDEPMTVQRGVIAAYSKLTGRRGIFEAPYTGDVYVIDAITNNPGAAGGLLTTRKGEPLAMIGKELRNTLTDTWINYAVPFQAVVEFEVEGKTQSLSLSAFVEKGIKGEYKPTQRPDAKVLGPGPYHGIQFVVDVVERTPPYVESVEPGSPAEKAGLRPDDLVVFVDGEPMISIKTFKSMMQKLRPNTTLKLEVRRGDKLQSVDLTVLDRPKQK